MVTDQNALTGGNTPAGESDGTFRLATAERLTVRIQLCRWIKRLGFVLGFASGRSALRLRTA